MPSNQSTRVIFQNSNLFVGPVAQSGVTATGSMYSSGNSGLNFIGELNRVQSIDLTASINRTDVNVFGRNQRIDSEVISSPTFTLNFGYLTTDGMNENLIGFNSKGITSFVSGMLTKTSDSKNYFISYSPPGVDDDGDTSNTNRDVAALGNGFVSNYSLNASVGQPVTSNVTVEGLNIAFYTGSSGMITPAVDPATANRITQWTFQLPVGDAYTGLNAISIIKPGDISINIPNAAGFGSQISGAFSANITSFSLSVPISRQKIEKLGSPFGVADEINFPVTCQLSVQGIQTNLQPASFDQLLCNDVPYNVNIVMRQPSCAGTGLVALNVAFNQAYMTNQRIGQSLGGNSTVSWDFSTQLASAASYGEGVIFSGYY